MSIIKMKEVSIIGRIKDYNNVLNKIQDLGILHVKSFNNNIVREECFERIKEIEAKLLQIRKVKSLLNMKNEKLNFQKIDNQMLQNMVLDVLELNKEKQEKSSKILQLEKKIELLQPWGSFNLEKFNILKKIGYYCVFGILNAYEWNNLNKNNLIFKIINQDNQNFWVFFILKEGLKLNIKSVDIPTEELDHLLKQKKLLEKRLSEIDCKLSSFAYIDKSLDGLNIKFLDELKRFQTQRKTFFYKSMFTIKGYVPTTEINIFESIMSKFLIVFFVMDPKDNDVPVKFDNIWFFKGFEFLIKNFNGLSYYEKDVTWCIGLLFIIFGSLCFLDAGYSILLILTGSALYYKKYESIGQMFAITGFFSFLLGLTSGQFFGLIVGQDIFTDMTPLIPLSTTPTKCLVFSLIVGAFIMLFSYSISIWQLGFRISLTGNSFFILSLMAHFIHQEVNLVFFEYVSKIFMIMTLLLWIMYPVDDLGKDARIANIVLTMYNGVVGSLQDIFSHMRLFGISLSGAILALVVNKIALMMPLIVTIIFSIIAHIIIYLLSVMSMYVHSSRLIFLEFGSNFIKGGNIFYSPLSRSLLK